MNIQKFEPLLINLFYNIVLINIALIILCFTHLLHIPFNASIVLVIMYYTSELFLFFSGRTSLGVSILSLILAVSCYKHGNLNEVLTKIKDYLFKVPCFH